MEYCLCMNQQKIDHLTERILNETLSAMSCLNLYLGHRLNLFQSIDDSGPISSTELSNKTKYSERYLREWLECMAVLGYIEHDPATNKFNVPQEHAAVLYVFATPSIPHIDLNRSALKVSKLIFTLSNPAAFSC